MPTIVDTLPRGYLEAEIGFEVVARAAVKRLAEELPAQLTHQADYWRQADIEEQQDIGGVGEIDLEPVLRENLYPAPHRSLLEQPIERFPNVSVIAYLTTPAPGVLDLDQVDEVSVTMAIETFVRSGPVTEASMLDHETIVTRRIQRTTEAVNRCLRSDPALFGTTLPGSSSAMPRGGIGPQLWARHQTSDDRWLLQGSRLEYAVQRLAHQP